MPSIDTDNLTRCVQTLETALGGLERETPGSPMHNVFRGACQYEFQAILEITASLLRRRIRRYFATVNQVNELTFAGALREAQMAGLLSMDESGRWLDYRERHYAMAHRHGTDFAEQALEVLPSLVRDARNIAEVIGAETDTERRNLTSPVPCE